MTPRGLQPSPHWLEHTIKQKTAHATCLSTNLQWLPLPSITTTTRTHRIWPHFSVLISHCPTIPNSTRQPCRKSSVPSSWGLPHHSAEADRWKVCEEWVGLERERHLALHPRMDLHLLKSIPCPLQYLQYQFTRYIKSLRLTVKISPGGRWQACTSTARA